MTLEIFFQFITALVGLAVIVWLCFERDLMHKRLEMLESENRRLSQKAFDISRLQDKIEREQLLKKINELESK